MPDPILISLLLEEALKLEVENAGLFLESSNPIGMTEAAILFLFPLEG